MFWLMRASGKGIMYIGAGALFLMAIVGTISIDLVILAAVSKDKKSSGGSFFTGYLLGSLFSKNDSSPVVSLILSPITTTIAIALAFVLGVPEVGVALAAGWGIAAGAVGLGWAVNRAGDMLEMLFNDFLTFMSKPKSDGLAPAVFNQPTNAAPGSYEPAPAFQSYRPLPFHSRAQSYMCYSQVNPQPPASNYSHSVSSLHDNHSPSAPPLDDLEPSAPPPSPRR